jgi:hypothetical protein
MSFIADPVDAATLKMEVVRAFLAAVRAGGDISDAYLAAIDRYLQLRPIPELACERQGADGRFSVSTRDLRRQAAIEIILRHRNLINRGHGDEIVSPDVSR